MDKEGARLTSYRFTSPLGGVFSYTVENDAEPTGGVEEIEAWEAEESSREMRRKAARQQVTFQYIQFLSSDEAAALRCPNQHTPCSYRGSAMYLMIKPVCNVDDLIRCRLPGHISSELLKTTVTWRFMPSWR